MDNIGRRSVLIGAGALALTGCQTYGGEQPSTSDNAGDGNGEPLAKAADVPVGGGVVLGDRGVVVTQPQAGTFKAFSASCTHQGCTLAEVSGGTINCGCHGSAFHIGDGSVAKGPATRPLPGKEIIVGQDGIRLA